VHLQPLTWRTDGWPVIGAATEGDAPGTPVMTATQPRVATNGASPSLQTSDEFSGPTLGLQWQWQANPRADWVSFDAQAGVMQLAAQPLVAPARSLWNAPNLLLQKFPSEQFEILTQLAATASDSADHFGVIVFGRDYAWLGLRRVTSGWQLVSSRTRDADRGTTEALEVIRSLATPDIHLRVRVTTGGVCRFAYSVDGAAFTELPAPFTAREGTWVGANVGVFASRNGTPAHTAGQLRVDYVRVRVL
jgi:beta-xylosidase